MEINGGFHGAVVVKPYRPRVHTAHADTGDSVTWRGVAKNCRTTASRFPLSEHEVAAALQRYQPSARDTVGGVDSRIVGSERVVPSVHEEVGTETISSG